MVEKYLKTNVCPLPWTHLEVDVNGGASPYIKAVCQM